MTLGFSESIQRINLCRVPRLLEADPRHRMTTGDALAHDFLRDFVGDQTTKRKGKSDIHNTQAL